MKRISKWGIGSRLWRLYRNHHWLGPFSVLSLGPHLDSMETSPPRAFTLSTQLLPMTYLENSSASLG